MNFHARAIERDGFDLDADDLSCLKKLEDAIQDSVLRPSVHPRVDRVPVTEALRQGTPLAPVFCDV
jgi:hypothetical protein